MRDKALLAFVAVLSVGRAARATDVLEFPDNGTEQMARGGAWVARASNPLATFYNPAGLAGQRSGVLANVNVVLNEICFKRAGDGEELDVGAKYPEVCNDNKGTLQPLPAIAGVLRLTPELGIGLSVAPPSFYGELEFPETVKTKNAFGATARLPAGSRYMLIKQSGIALNTTLGAGLEVVRDFRVGAGFVWGIGSYRLANANMSLNPDQQADGRWLDPTTNDIRAELSVADWFMPGITVGVLYSPIEELDLGLNVTAQEAFDAHGDLEMKANYWTNDGTSGNPDVTDSADIEEGLAHFRNENPLEARVGARFHLPRSKTPKPEHVRDPLADDVFDIELDISYTRNSAYERAKLRFPASPVVQVKGTPGAVPENNDVDFKVKGDTIGVRLGGDFVILPAKLAVRAGGWFEPDAQNEQYANVTFLASQRFGLALGGTYRLGSVDIEAGYMHVFFAEVDNGGDGKLLVVSGDATTNFRSPYGINGGRFTQSVNVFSAGATMRF